MLKYRLQTEMMNMTMCEECINYEYDEDYDCMMCSVDMDMDETESVMNDPGRGCPFYTPGDEYTIVRKQN